MKLDDYTPDPRATKVGLRERYDELCKLRDATNEATKELRAKATAANNDAEAARIIAAKANAEFHAARGGPKWTALKNEIGQLARLLPPVEQKEEA